MALVICIHPGSLERATAFGMSPNRGDCFVLLEDATLTNPEEPEVRRGKLDLSERGSTDGTHIIDDGELVRLIFEHNTTFIC